MRLSRASGVDESVAGLSLAGAGAGREAGKSGRVMSIIRSATHFTRATRILPMSKDFVREKTDW